MERDHLKPGTSDAGLGSESISAEVDRQFPAESIDTAGISPSAPRRPFAAPEPQLQSLDDLRRALADLPSIYRIAIEMRSLARRPFADLAETLGRTTDEARRLWYDALVQLQERMTRHARAISDDE